MPYLKQLLVFILLSFLFSSCSNKPKKETNVTQELIKLAELKEKGVLTEDEFQTKKIELLKM